MAILELLVDATPGSGPGGPSTPLVRGLNENGAELDRFTPPTPWFQDLMRWLPGGGALSPIASSAPPMSPHPFTAWGEFAVFSGYAVVLLALGAWSFIRRDA
jgi:hypothetical protein